MAEEVTTPPAEAQNPTEPGVPVFMHAGTQAECVQVGWVATPGDMPALLRAVADAWEEMS